MGQESQNPRGLNRGLALACAVMAPSPTIAVFDLGGVLIDWNPRHLYRKLFGGDDAAMEHFLATVCTQPWNECQDAGRPFAEALQVLCVDPPDRRALIAAWGLRF